MLVKAQDLLVSTPSLFSIRRKTEGTPHLYNIKELGLLVTKIIGNLQNEFAAQMIS